MDEFMIKRSLADLSDQTTRGGNQLEHAERLNQRRKIQYVKPDFGLDFDKVLKAKYARGLISDRIMKHNILNLYLERYERWVLFSPSSCSSANHANFLYHLDSEMSLRDFRDMLEQELLYFEYKWKKLQVTVVVDKRQRELEEWGAYLDNEKKKKQREQDSFCFSLFYILFVIFWWCIAILQRCTDLLLNSLALIYLYFRSGVTSWGWLKRGFSSLLSQPISKTGAMIILTSLSFGKAKAESLEIQPNVAGDAYRFMVLTMILVVVTIIVVVFFLVRALNHYVAASAAGYQVLQQSVEGVGRQMEQAVARSISSSVQDVMAQPVMGHVVAAAMNLNQMTGPTGPVVAGVNAANRLTQKVDNAVDTVGDLVAFSAWGGAIFILTRRVYDYFMKSNIKKEGAVDSTFRKMVDVLSLVFFVPTILTGSWKAFGHALRVLNNFGATGRQLYNGFNIVCNVLHIPLPKIVDEALEAVVHETVYCDFCMRRGVQVEANQFIGGPNHKSAVCDRCFEFEKQKRQMFPAEKVKCSSSLCENTAATQWCDKNGKPFIWLCDLHAKAMASEAKSLKDAEKQIYSSCFMASVSSSSTSSASETSAPSFSGFHKQCGFNPSGAEKGALKCTILDDKHDDLQKQRCVCREAKEQSRKAQSEYDVYILTNSMPDSEKVIQLKKACVSAQQKAASCAIELKKMEDETSQVRGHPILFDQQHQSFVRESVKDEKEPVVSVAHTVVSNNIQAEWVANQLQASDTNWDFVFDLKERKKGPVIQWFNFNSESWAQLIFSLEKRFMQVNPTCNNGLLHVNFAEFAVSYALGHINYSPDDEKGFRDALLAEILINTRVRAERARERVEAPKNLQVIEATERAVGLNNPLSQAYYDFLHVVGQHKKETAVVVFLFVAVLVGIFWYGSNSSSENDHSIEKEGGRGNKAKKKALKQQLKRTFPAQKWKTAAGDLYIKGINDMDRVKKIFIDGESIQMDDPVGRVEKLRLLLHKFFDENPNVTQEQFDFRFRYNEEEDDVDDDIEGPDEGDVHRRRNKVKPLDSSEQWKEGAKEDLKETEKKIADAQHELSATKTVVAQLEQKKKYQDEIADQKLQVDAKLKEYTGLVEQLRQAKIELATLQQKSEHFADVLKSQDEVKKQIDEEKKKLEDIRAEITRNSVLSSTLKQLAANEEKKDQIVGNLVLQEFEKEQKKRDELDRLKNEKATTITVGDQKISVPIKQDAKKEGAKNGVTILKREKPFAKDYPCLNPTHYDNPSLSDREHCPLAHPLKMPALQDVRKIVWPCATLAYTGKCDMGDECKFNHITQFDIAKAFIKQIPCTRKAVHNQDICWFKHRPHVAKKDEIRKKQAAIVEKGSFISDVIANWTGTICDSNGIWSNVTLLQSHVFMAPKHVVDKCDLNTVRVRFMKKIFKLKKVSAGKKEVVSALLKLPPDEQKEHIDDLCYEIYDIGNDNVAIIVEPMADDIAWPKPPIMRNAEVPRSGATFSLYRYPGPNAEHITNNSGYANLVVASPEPGTKTHKITSYDGDCHGGIYQLQDGIMVLVGLHNWGSNECNGYLPYDDKWKSNFQARNRYVKGSYLKLEDLKNSKN